ncbi:MAG: 2-C-methyl-D-erythritol 2,4-cyclodiphosphate synthase [Acidobacteria bacterium]|nr:2-C-methyl-D-erythritol 2,4-cyclodiphosphate synthase [Acidobacteriota bacterium]
MTRIGFGYDVHAFSPGRPLVLGGVEIPAERGLLGHSDADVLLHAICDALLGAAARGDLGRHFPDDVDQFRGKPSTEFQKEVAGLIETHPYTVVNLDATVVLETPRIAAYVPRMRETIAGVLELEPDRVSVKATTHERLGALGKGEGCAAYAVALIQSVGGE